MAAVNVRDVTLVTDSISLGRTIPTIVSADTDAAAIQAGPNLVTNSEFLYDIQDIEAPTNWTLIIGGTGAPTVAKLARPSPTNNTPWNANALVLYVDGSASPGGEVVSWRHDKFIPVAENLVYTLSCWARKGTGGNPVSIKFGVLCYDVDKNYLSAVYGFKYTDVDILDSQWNELTAQFGSTGDPFAINTKYVRIIWTGCNNASGTSTGVTYATRFGFNQGSAKAYNHTPTPPQSATDSANNLYPDFDVYRADLYHDSGEEITFAAVGNNNDYGANAIIIPYSASTINVYTDWFPIEPNTEYLVSAPVQMYGAGTCTATIYIQFAELDSNVIGTTTTTTIGSRTDDQSTARFEITATTGTTDRRARFKVTRTGGGSQVARSGAFRIEKKTTSSLIKDLAVTTPKLNINSMYTLPTAGSIAAGQTAYNIGTGWYAGNPSATPKFSVGNGATGTKQVTWDGTDLTIIADYDKISGLGVQTNLSTLNVAHYTTGANCYVAVNYHTTGNMRTMMDTTSGGTFVVRGSYYKPASTGAGTAYYIRFTELYKAGTGTLSGSTIGDTWNQISTTRTIGLTQSTAGTTTVILGVDISTSASSAGIVATGMATLFASRT